MGKNIVLCGFMGSGKTTVGKCLAQKLNIQFVDMDCEIERIAGMTVPEIFENFGEPHFRALESRVCEELGKKSNLVIAVGGGAILKSENQKALSNNGIIIYLEVSVNTIISRLKHDKSRPLLNQQNKADVINNLMQQRLPIYQKAADLIVNAQGHPEQIADKIINLINLKF